MGCRAFLLLKFLLGEGVGSGFWALILSSSALACASPLLPVAMPTPTVTAMPKHLTEAVSKAPTQILSRRRGRWLPYAPWAWRIGTEVYLVDPQTLRTKAKLATPDGSPPVCLTPVEGGSQLLLSQQGQLSLWDDKGELRATSKESLGPSDDCFSGQPDTLRISWEPGGTRFLTRSTGASTGPFLGVWLWSVNGTQLESRQVLEGESWEAGFLQHQDGIWAEMLGSKAFLLVPLDGRTSRSFEGDIFALSPDETKLVVSHTDPRPTAKLINLDTDHRGWATTGGFVLGWSPSMKWLTGVHGERRAVFSAPTGIPVATWEGSGLGCDEERRWVGELWIDADGDRITFWRPGTSPITHQLDCLGGGAATVAHHGKYTLSLNTIWNLETLSPLRHLEASTAEDAATCGVMADTWSADDRFIVGGLSEALVVWNANDGKRVSVLRGLGAERPIWDTSGHRLFVATPKELVIHDPQEQWTVVLYPELVNGFPHYTVVHSEGCNLTLPTMGPKPESSCQQLSAQLGEVNR